MRSAFYSPYLDSFGGGERYLLTAAEFFSRTGEVIIFWDDATILPKLENRFNLNLKKVKILPNIFTKNLFQRWRILKRFDLALILSDGSIPTPFAAKNILHFQEPITAKSKNFKNWLKLKKYIVVCNSNFTKKYIDQSLGVNSQVLYPPVDIDFFAPPVFDPEVLRPEWASGQQKENVILSVGRFLPGGQGKKHEVLIEAFKRAVDTKKEFQNWQLWFVGGVGDKKYLADLKKIAKDYKINFFEDVNANQLKKLYQKAKIYWHAKGFGEDVGKHPEFAEHFGISIIEAQAAGVVPIVFAAGGVVEIIDDGVTGFFWKDTKELIDQTKTLIEDKNLLENIRNNAMTAAKQFSKEKFFNNFEKII